MTTRSKKALLVRMEEKSNEKVVADDISGDPVTSSTHSSRSLRGRTVMHCLSMQRVQGVRKEVEFNSLGQPVGPIASKMQSFIGVLAREKVKITYLTWKVVPNDVKDQIWESVNLSFIVDPNWKSGCLSSANTKWRQFKTKLTNEFVYKRLGSPNLNTPPADYPCIEEKDWSSFVISRLSDDFKKMREEQKERRTKCVYPYRLSRLGYAQYAKDHPHILCEDPEINQATLWVEARKTKDGNHEGEDLKEKVSKIGEFISKKKEGSLSFEGDKNTILSQVLGSEEHHGRLRGVGGHVTERSYYKVPRREKSKRDKLYDLQQRELSEERKKNAERDERIARLEAALLKVVGPGVDVDEKGSCSVKYKPDFIDDVQHEHANSPIPVDNPANVCKLDEDDVQFVEDNVELQGKLVALSLESGINIAAYGTIVKVNGPNELIHGMQMPENCMRVSIDEAVDENAPLPIPTHECLSIGDAIGSHVAWPIHLMKLEEEKAKKKRKSEKIKKSVVDFSSIPTPLRMVYCYCKASLEGKGNIMIPLEQDVFGSERTLYVHIEDVEPFCQLQPISYTCITVYIWHLYNKIRSLSGLNKFKFVDPWNIGHVPYTKRDNKTIHDAMEQRARDLASGLDGTLIDQIVLVPVNVGVHWILTVIDPHKEEVGILDPLYNGIRDGVWKQVVELALKMFSAVKMSKGRKKPTWTIIKAPKQPDAFQCGFYVMKYMKQIVESDPFEKIASMQSLFTKETYTEAEINEVRKEWAERVQEHIYEY